MAANVCHKKVLDDCGRFVWNVAEYNGHIYKPYKGDLVQRLERYKKWFPVYDGDIYLPAYSKSGTHWVWEILMMLTRGSANYQKEHKIDKMFELGFDVEVDQGADRGILNTHLRYGDMPPAVLSNTRGKIIQVHRNPADVAVSFYYHLRNEANGAAMTYEWNEFISKLYCNPEKMVQGTWFDYTREWWAGSRENSNYLAVYYEELIEVTPSLLQEIVAQTEFQKMKEGKQELEGVSLKSVFTHGYTMYRKGTVGDWRNHFTKEQHQQFMEYFDQQLQDYPELHQKFAKYLQW